MFALAAGAIQGQRLTDKTVVSDEFNFIAVFPEPPIKSEGPIETRFGKAYSRRWTLQLTGVFYELSVDDFQDLTVERNHKALNAFYDSVCSDFASQYGARCDNYYGKELFGEVGKHAGGRTKDLFVFVDMYLVNKRLYQLKHVMRTSMENDRQAARDLQDFQDKFVFVYRKANEEKYSYGLLPSISWMKRDSQNYPANWFASVNDRTRPAWEILPHEAKPGEVILSKRNELGILSNFAATPFEMDGKKYASVEGFWQMMLYPEGTRDERARDKRVIWKYTRDQVAQMTAFEAKQAGTLAEENMKTLGIDWVSYNGKRFPYRSQTPGEHYRLIVAAMRAKLEQNPEVKRILLATGDLILKPDHHGEENPPPEWRYYEIWMQLRLELRDAQSPRRAM